MEKPCCIGVVRDPSGLKGKEAKLGDLTYYITSPSETNKKNLGVVVIHDIFGFSIPNTKYIVDHLASQGFEAVMGDLYGSIGSWPEDKEIGGEFGAWFGKITTPEFFAGVAAHVKSLVDFLTQRGNTKVGVIGFCWGGLVTGNVIAPTGLVSAAVSLHGINHNGTTVTNAKCPVFFITVVDDPYFSKEQQEEVKHEVQKQGKGAYKIFEGVRHGFVVRGDFQGNPDLKKKSEEALADTVEFLSTHLK